MLCRICILLVVLVVSLSADLSVDLIERCCVRGSGWATTTRGACTAYPENLLDSENLDDDDIKSCQSLANICCTQTYSHEQCTAGKDIYVATSTCSNIRVIRGNTELYTHQRECCQCCQLGALAASASVSCDLFQSSGKICEKSADCCGAFYSCCNSGGSSSASSTTTPTTTTTTTTTVAPDVAPVHSPDGICFRFSSALCEHFCHDAPDRPNKFKCSCRRGFELAGNQRNCVESMKAPTCETADRCGFNAECYMRRGVPACRCVSSGYKLSGSFQCADVNECTQGTHNCSRSQTCTNTDGGFKCDTKSCPSNQKLNTTSGQCVSNQGTGTNVCPTGYAYDRSSGACVSTHSQNSTCPTGYAKNVINNLCEDIDECATGKNDCDASQTCENTVGSYNCKRRISCGTGYSLQASLQTCVDIDECDLGTHNCGPAFTCHNVPGSFRCEYKICPRGQRLNITTGDCVGAAQCEKGFVWTEYSRSCEDVNECLYENPCLPSESCTNTEGSYRCVGSSKLTCYNGYEINVYGTTCEDINECERGIHNCLSRNHCTNTQGSFRCRCDTGYALNSVSNTCKDINECSRSVGQFCSPTNSECVNTPGSFYCKCKDGFESIANGRACQDKDECATPNLCQHTCHNVWGSFQCRCHPGYRLAADKRSCNDVNECQMSSSRGRLCNGFCENTPGSFKCVCPAGYKLADNGRECLDIDECAEGLAGCNGANAVCVNTRGSFKCEIVECPRYFATSSDSSSRNSVRCARQTFVCSQGDVECLTAPLSLSYNFLTLRSSRLRIPTELFTMRGPDTFPRIEFALDVKSVDELTRDSIAVTNDHFRVYVDPQQPNVAVVSIVLPIQGPQDIKIQLDMNIYNDSGFFGTAAATITIYATVDPWEDTN